MHVTENTQTDANKTGPTSSTFDGANSFCGNSVGHSVFPVAWVLFNLRCPASWPIFVNRGFGPNAHSKWLTISQFGRADFK